MEVGRSDGSVDLDMSPAPFRLVLLSLLATYRDCER